MTKNELEKYKKYKQLIAAYQAEADSDLEVTDTVQGSMLEYPFVERVISIHGQDMKRKQWLRQRIYDLDEHCTRIEAFVATVDDEYMRSMLYWHYIKGLSWTKVRKMLGMHDVTPDCLRMRVEKFFKNTC